MFLLIQSYQAWIIELQYWKWFCSLGMSPLGLFLSGMFSDIPEDEARYWAKKLEQINAMRDQDVSCLFGPTGHHLTQCNKPLIFARLLGVKVQLFPLNLQYSYQEEQERPLRVPGTQCCKCPFGVCPIQSFIRVKQENDVFSFADVIRLPQLNNCIVCVTTRALQCVSRERGHCSLHCKGSIVVSDAQRWSVVLKDAVVPPLLGQSVNHPEPSVRCKGWNGQRFSLTVATAEL